MCIDELSDWRETHERLSEEEVAAALHGLMEKGLIEEYHEPGDDVARYRLITNPRPVEATPECGTVLAPVEHE